MQLILPFLLMACNKNAGEPATITAEATFLSDPIDSFVTHVTTEAEIGQTYNPILVDPDTYEIIVGNRDVNDSLEDAPTDIPLLEDYNGTLIGFTSQSVTVEASEDVTVHFEAAMVFWGDYVCSDRICSLEDSSNCNEGTDLAKTIYVNSDFDIEVESGSNVLGGYDLSVSGDKINLSYEGTTTNVSSTIHENGFTLNYTNEWSVHNITCTKQ